MDPNLPQPVNQGPYDFIMGSGQPAKGRSPLKAGGSGQLRRFIPVVLGGLILVVLLVIVFSILTSGGKKDIAALKGLAASQTELIRVADLGIVKVKSTSAKNMAATASLTLKTMRQRTTTLVTIKGGKITPQELNAKKDAAIDTALTSAEQNNRYDEALVEYLINGLTSYRAALKTIHDGATETNDRNVLGDGFKGATLILENQLAQAN